ncbi:bypass of stop codon protein 6 [Monosporozyma unispora]|nr:Bypass of stop codon protein 6 [Kazachstania unispora]
MSELRASNDIELEHLNSIDVKRSSEELQGLGIHQEASDPLISGSKINDTESNPFEEESPNLKDDTWRAVQWKGREIQVYPLDYQRYGIVRWQIIACLVMFMVFGFNDQSLGALIPTLVEEYNISEVRVSNVFLVQLAGYSFASLLNERIHFMFGMRGGMLVASTLCLVFFTILASKPSSFFLCALCIFPLGLAIGILDASGNVFIGNLLVHKNEIMGIMHAIYGAAAMLTPPLVTHFEKWGHWSWFFLIPLVLSLIGTIIIIPSFKYETDLKYDYTCNKDNVNDDENTDPNTKESFFQLFQNPAILLHALFLFTYLGAEITTGAWFFSYLLKTKLADKIKMSYIASSYWIGLTVGRLVLGFVTKRAFVNEYRAARTYCFLTVISYVLFTIIGTFNSHSTFYFVLLFFVVFSCGFFIGPLFPSASIVALQVLPARLHVSGIGIAVALGGCGGAALPYLSGVLIHLIGMNYFPLITTILVSFFTIIWLLYPRYIKDHPEFL